VWVGTPGGDAHTRKPLPLAIGSKTCRFRPVALQALREAGRGWQVILEVSNQDAVIATIASGSCVGITLRDCIPESLEILGDGCGLPELPDFAINLWLPKTGASEIAEELARHVRAEFAARYASSVGGAPQMPNRRVARRSAAAAHARSPHIASIRRTTVR
jgi:DNA-binding transcriptional LysR family regulator